MLLAGVMFTGMPFKMNATCPMRLLGSPIAYATVGATVLGAMVYERWGPATPTEKMAMVSALCATGALGWYFMSGGSETEEQEN